MQAQLAAALDAASPGTISLVAMCAGQGRDVLPVLATHPRGHDVKALLVEMSAELVADARRTCEQQGLANVEIVEGDAAETSMYAGAVPADVILVCGVFGSITEDEMQQTVRELPYWCAPGATAIWTKEGNPPDLRPFVRQLFTDAGFEETAYVTEADAVFGVGSARWNGEGRPFRPGRRLFTFRPRG